MTKYILSKSFELNEIIINQYIIILMYGEEDIFSHSFEDSLFKISYISSLLLPPKGETERN